MTKVQDFVKKFDSTDKTHVTWLKKICDVTAQPDNKMFADLWMKNPLGIHMSGDDLLHSAEIHFTLAMKYTTDVLVKGKAWVPINQ